MAGLEGASGAGTPPEIDKVTAPATPARAAAKSPEKAAAPTSDVDLAGIEDVMAAASAVAHTESSPATASSGTTPEAGASATPAQPEAGAVAPDSAAEEVAPASSGGVAPAGGPRTRSISPDTEPPATPDAPETAPATSPARSRRIRNAGDGGGSSGGRRGGGATSTGGTSTGGAGSGGATSAGGSGTGGSAPTPAPGTPRRETPPTRPTPDEEAPPAARESVDRAVLDKGAEFFYHFLTGKNAKADAAQEKLLGLGLCKREGEGLNASTRTLFAEAAYTKDKQAELLALEKQFSKEKNPATRAHLESEIRKGKLELEHRLDAMKVAWLDRWKEDNKERNPSLTKKELENEAITYSARTIFLAATNFYPEHEVQRGECVAQTEQEKGLFRRYGEWVNKQPRWKRIAVSAAIAGGVGGVMAATGIGALGAIGVPLAVGSRVGRSLFAGSLSATITSGVERFFGKRLDDRAKRKKTAEMNRIQQEKDVVNDERSRAFEARLRAELAGKEGWLEDHAKALKIMSKVDTDARAFALERGQCFSAQERAAQLIGTKWRRRLAIGTGLAVGGGMALSSVDWDRVPGYINGLRDSVLGWFHDPKIPTPVGGGGGGIPSGAGAGAGAATGGGIEHVGGGGHTGDGTSILERCRARVLGICGTEGITETPPTGINPAEVLPDPLPIPDVTEANVLTIGHGGNVWKVAHSFIGDTVQGTDGPVKMTKAMFNEAWANSTVEMVTEHGKHIQVPISSVDLTHAGDQVMLSQKDGHWIFQVGDYAKDHFKVGNTAYYRETLLNNNIPVPRWLERPSLPPATLVESHSGVLASAREALRTGVASTPDMSGFPEQLYSPEGVQEATAAFAASTLDQQEATIATLSYQIDGLEETMRTAGYPPGVLAQMTSYHNELINLQQQLIGNTDYLANITDFGTVLESHSISPDFFASVQDMRMDDFATMTEGARTAKQAGSNLAAIFRIYREDAESLRQMMLDVNPDCAEIRRMTVGQFMKSHTDALAVSAAS